MTEIRFDGQVVLVTGAERGLGAPHGILANAIAPAAAMRMLRRPVEPGELEPEQVAVVRT